MTYISRIQSLILPSRTIFGVGSLEKVGEEVEALGANKALIVTDKNMQRTGNLLKLMQPLHKAGIEAEVYEDVEPEPSLKDVEKVVEASRKRRYDIVIGFGGGSSMDMAKVASLMATNSGKVSDYIGVNLAKERGLPKILVPTTSGTGSEATPYAIVSSQGMKLAIVTPYNMPDLALIDPELTLSMPPSLTAYTGLDALSHAVESLMSLDANSMSDALSLMAIKLIRENLVEAYVHGDNLKARENMSMAAYLAGISIANAGTCAGHAVAYAFAAKYKVVHGLSCILTLPYVMSFNAISCMPKLEMIAEALGERTSETSQFEAANRSVNAIKEFLKIFGIPISLADVDVPKEAISGLAEDVLKSSRLLIRNPRKIEKEEALSILSDMWEGKIGV